MHVGAYGCLIILLTVAVLFNTDVKIKTVEYAKPMC